MGEEKTLRIRVCGIVQGVGFRPTVSRHAMKHRVRGNVCNKGPYVEIWAQGAEEDLDAFLLDLKEKPPERAVILKSNVEDFTRPSDLEKTGFYKTGKVGTDTWLPVFSDFQIIESEKRKGDIFVSPDIAICPRCKKELFDPANRRYLHPFINCTCCGPRLTILDAMPYDRERTSMKEFPMCESCAFEYTHPQTRRYDAQPVCCNDCGPKVYLIGSEERGSEAITFVRQCIADGGIAAIKGIGGFHLCCDATKESAVRLLRQRKKRPAKPFAVMMKNLSVVERECQLPEEAKEVLDGHQKPIVLLEKKEGGRICADVAPDNPKVGVLLPYAPIQLLLFQYDDGITMPDCLVMTSANTSGAPICREDRDAVKELSGICDKMLSNNRKIRIRADDSVMDFYDGEPYMIRRSRGYAPLPFMMKEDFEGEVLAVGGELKNSFCIGKNSLFYPSPYIGDMGDIRTVNALEESIERMEELLEAHIEMVACDLHPGYNTTQFAENMGLPLLKVQHHYAHILSCMAENEESGPVIGVAFDGTGYGSDGTIWGGEFLVSDYDGFTRWGSIAPFLQVGGDVSAKEGWRIAVSMLFSLYGEETALSILTKWKLCEEKTAKVQFAMAKRKINTVVSTSAGRLFDAVSAMLGVRTHSTFEGEASITLEFVAEEYEKKSRRVSALCPENAIENSEDDSKSSILFSSQNGEETVFSPQFTLNTNELVRWIVEGILAGKDRGELAYGFHQKLAGQIVEGCCYIRKKTGILVAALSGGVYQNQLLLRLSEEGLKREGFVVRRHHLLPPNDGGICLGQAVAAMRALQKKKCAGNSAVKGENTEGHTAR